MLINLRLESGVFKIALKDLLSKAKEGVVSTVLTLVMAAAPLGCSIEVGGTNEEPTVYGTEYGDTIENLKVEKCLCSEDVPQGEDLFLYDLQHAKVIWFTIHGGTCHFCHQQSAYMEKTDIYGKYKAQNLEILMVFSCDDAGSFNRENLLDYCCDYKKGHNFTFPLAIDPGAEITGKYTWGLPLNMLIDDEMTIRYKVEGFDSEGVEGHLDSLLEE